MIVGVVDGDGERDPAPHVDQVVAGGGGVVLDSGSHIKVIAFGAAGTADKSGRRHVADALRFVAGVRASVEACHQQHAAIANLLQPPLRNLQSCLLSQIECSLLPCHDVPLILARIGEFCDVQGVAVANGRFGPGTAKGAAAGSEQCLDRLPVVGIA